MTSCVMLVLCSASCITVGVSAYQRAQLQEAITWNQIDLEFQDDDERLSSNEFIPENNLPVGLEVWGNKIFVTIPRWKTGVPVSLAYIDTLTLNDGSENPKLNPYPNWIAHNQSSLNPYRIVSPIRVRVDSCNRLWILDSGQSDLFGDLKVLSFPQIIVYDLLTDQLISNFTLPEEQVFDRSRFITIAVDVLDCTRTWAYLADFAGPSLVVYDWELNKSWRVNDHEYFNHDDMAVNYNVSGTNFTWTDGIFGLALTEIDWMTSARQLFFHPFSSFDEFYVTTDVLRDEQKSKDPTSKDKFMRAGTRGENTQSGPAYVSEEHGVLFYSLVNLNAIGCWNYRLQPTYTPASQDLVAVDNQKLIFPNDLKVDCYGNLWVLSNNMQNFVFSSLDKKDVNFRILTAPISDLIRYTKCDNIAVYRGFWFSWFSWFSWLW